MIGRTYSFGFVEGYDGATIATISTNVLPYLPLVSPKYILLIAGANDLVTGSSPATAYSALTTFMANMFAAQVSISKILVGTTPVGLNSFGQSTYNGLILGTSISNVIPVDASGTLVYPTDYTDQFHPNEQGYTKMATQWSPVVDALL